MVDYYWVYHITGFLHSFLRSFHHWMDPITLRQSNMAPRSPFLNGGISIGKWRFNGDEIIENPLSMDEIPAPFMEFFLGEGHLLKNQLKNMEDLPRLPDDYLADRPWEIPGLRRGEC